MNDCPICGKRRTRGKTCACGYNESEDYEAHLSLAVASADTKTADAKRQEAQEAILKAREATLKAELSRDFQKQLDRRERELTEAFNKRLKSQKQALTADFQKQLKTQREELAGQLAAMQSAIKQL